MSIKNAKVLKKYRWCLLFAALYILLLLLPVKMHSKRDDLIVLQGTDVQNPLYPYRIPVKSCVYNLADTILGKESQSLTKHEKILRFMQYIEQFEVDVLSGYTGEEYLQVLIDEKRGQCGDYSNLLAALCATQGIETRLITLGNYPEGSGHAVIEALVNGKWAMYDPTYSLYYIRVNEDGIAEVLSFEELRNGRGAKWIPFE